MHQRQEILPSQLNYAWKTALSDLDPELQVPAGFRLGPGVAPLLVARWAFSDHWSVVEDARPACSGDSWRCVCEKY